MNVHKDSPRGVLNRLPTEYLGVILMSNMNLPETLLTL